jgi:hypothetical protein
MRLDMSSLSSAVRDLIDDRLPALPRLAVALRAGQADDGIPEVDLSHGGADLDALIGDVLRLRNDLAPLSEEARRTGQYGEHYGEAYRVVTDWLAVLVDERERLLAGGHAGETELRDGQARVSPETKTRDAASRSRTRRALGPGLRPRRRAPHRRGAGLRLQTGRRGARGHRSHHRGHLVEVQAMIASARTSADQHVADEERGDANEYASAAAR